jgi:type I restriction enzyme S subunit
LIFSDKMFRFRPDPRLVDPAFLLSFLTSTTGLRLIEPLKTGSNDSGLRISQAAFLGLVVPVPSLEEQHDVVGRLAAVTSRVDRVRSEVDRARSRATALSHSLRSSALGGRLLSGADDQHPSPIEYLEEQ